MITNIKKLLLVPLFGLAFTTNASAVVIDGPANILLGINEYINVTEQAFFSESDYGVEYSDYGVEYAVDILDEDSLISVTSFAVSTNSRAGVVDSDRNGWIGEQLSALMWDNDGFYSALGSFNSFFGTDLYVNIYNYDDDGGNAIMAASDGMFEFRAFDAVLSSDFVALNANGGIIDQSRVTNDVPEPAPLALLGFGLIGIGMMRKRRKA